MKYEVSFWSESESRWVPYYSSKNLSDVIFYEKLLRQAGLQIKTGMSK